MKIHEIKSFFTLDADRTKNILVLIIKEECMIIYKKSIEIVEIKRIKKKKETQF